MRKIMLMRLFFTQLFVSERKQIAYMADEKSTTLISHRLFTINCSETRIIMNDYILITGASRGIGRAIAIKFAKARYHVIIVSKNNYDDLLNVKKEIESYGGTCYAYKCDVSSYDELLNLKKSLENLKIYVSCLINNAGICDFGLFQDLDITTWNNIIATNLSSVFYMSKIFIPDMLHLQKGSIINISSVWGNVGASCEVAYSASKGGVNSLTKALAKELAPSHINVNAVACGAIDTTMNSRLTPEEKTDLEEEIPYGRMGTCEEVANLVYNIFNSPDYLTGQIITFDGGWT